MLDSVDLDCPETGAIRAESDRGAGETGARLSAWLEAVEQAAPEAWRPVADLGDLPPHVRADSQFWCDGVFAPAANPHDATGVTRAARRGEGRSPDLLRHRYAAAGLDLTLIEGRNFLLVEVARKSLDLLALPEAERPAAVARAAAALFREPVRFQHCAPVADGSLFCTDADADPLLLASWAERAEGGVRGGELWFVCYKRVAQQVGFANPAQWWSDAQLTRPARPAPRRAPPRRRRA
jgi:hypothetical protein